MPPTRSLLLVAIVLATSLAGCTTPTGSDGPPPIPASRAVELAEDAAQDWADDAQLVLLSGVEASGASRATRDVPEASGDASPRTFDDANVGDGRAPGWTALFYSETLHETRSFQVDLQTIEDLGGDAPTSGTPTVLAAWSVDSPDAVGEALSNATFRQAALASDGAVFMTLGMQDGGPVWELTARSHANGGHAVVRVNATAG